MYRHLLPRPVNYWMDANYGSRRGFVLTWWSRLLYYAGRYRDYNNVDWNGIERLVFVCKGNVCRSAFAEVVATANGLQAISCGIEAGDDVPAYSDAVAAAARRGFSLDEHRTTPLGRVDLRDTDLLIAMEPGQAAYLAENCGSGCTLLGLWGRKVIPYIHDPYGQSAEYFDVCFEYLEHAVHEIDGKIKNTAGN